MRKRRERILKELYDVTERLSEAEITPVLKGSWRIQGPVDELDHNAQVNPGLFPSEKRIGKRYLNEDLYTRAESGTCNVCSAPCSSCMHFNRAVPAMESKIESAFSDNTRKESDHCSFINTGMPTLYKSRACDDRHLAASETSNLVSASSSHDSFSENAESKSTMRTETYDASEDVDMSPKVTSCETAGGDQFQAKKHNSTAQTVLSSQSPAASDLLRRSFSSREERQRGLECHGDNISCVTGVRDAHIAVGDLETIFNRSILSSSASTSGLLVKGLKESVQVQTSGEIEESHSNSGRPRTYTTDFSHKKSSSSSSANVEFTHKSDRSECLPSNADPSPKVQSPYSHFQSAISFFCGADSKDLEQNYCSQLQGEPSECYMEHVESSLAVSFSTGDVEGQKSTALNPADVKASHVRSESSSGAPRSTNQCLEPECGTGSGNQPDESMKCDNLNEQFGKSSSLLEASDKRGPQPESQPNTESENLDPDIVEDDVKVCDICGDAGREDLLAFCSRCSDGAEHTYCMRIMLDKVPEGDWLCEECKLKEDAENQIVDKSETISGASKEPCLNEKSLNSGGIYNPKILPKLDTKPIDAEAIQSPKGLQSPLTSTRRHTDNVEVTSTSNKKVPETNVGFAGTSSPSRKTALSRESSFKNLDVGKVNPVNMAPPSGSQSANSSQVIARSVTSGPNLSRVQSLQSPRGLLSKSTSFNNLNSKPRVKQVIENVALKPILTRESATSDLKKDGFVRTVNKSASFKGTTSGRSNTSDSTSKTHAVNPSLAVDPRSMKQGKERNVIERKFSFKLDRSLNSSRIVGTSISLPKADPKAAQQERKLNNLFESSTPNSNKGLEDANDLVGLNEVKKQSSNSSRIPSSNGVCNEDQKLSQVVHREDTRTSSSATDKLCRPDTVLECGLPQSSQSTNLDEKNKENTSFSNTRQTVSTGSRVLRCQKCNETGHTTQFCSIDKLRVSALKPSANSRETANKSNKWKDAVEATMSRNRPGKSNGLSDQSEELILSSTDLSCEIAPKDLLSSTSGCVRNLTSLEGASDKQEILKGSTAGHIKSATTIDVKEQVLRPMETVCAPRHGNLSALGESKVKPLTQFLPEGPSILVNPLRVSAIPEHDYIWQGIFEVQRAGRLPELCDGVQAHLSTFASSKVLEVVTKFPSKVLLEEVPRLSSWPLQFQDNCPTEENIALFFFAKDVESYEKNYRKLLENMLKNDLALKGKLDGTELLIFPSNWLPEKSQRWNRLFFLWGVFRGKRSICSEPPSDLQKKLCGSSMNVERLDEDFPTQPITETSVTQKISSSEHIDKELHGYDRSTKTEPARSTACLDSPLLTSFESDNSSSNTNEHSLDQKSQYQADVDNKLPSGKHASCSFPESCSVTSMSQKIGILDTSSESGVGTNAAQMFSQVKGVGTCLKGSIGNVGGTKDASLPLHVQKVGVQNNLCKDRELPAYSSNCGQADLPLSSRHRLDLSLDSSELCQPNPSLVVQGIGAEGCSDEENMRNERLMEGPTTSLRGSLAAEEYLSWELKPNRKRAHSYSPEPVSHATCETSKSTSETILWKDKRDCISLDEGKDHKKMKLFHEVHPCDGSREEHLVDGFSSKVHPLLATLLDEQTKDSVCNETTMPESSRSTERYFFPVNLGSLRNAESGKLEPLQVLSPEDDPPESDVPNLELALGVEKKSPKQGMLPLLLPLADRKSNIEKMSAPSVDNGDDVSASLSLSLAFPFSEKEPTAKPNTKTQQLLAERPHVNTSLHLFSPFTDT